MGNPSDSINFGGQGGSRGQTPEHCPPGYVFGRFGCQKSGGSGSGGPSYPGIRRGGVGGSRHSGCRRMWIASIGRFGMVC